MSNLFGKAKNLAGQALNTLLFARKESDGSDMQPDSSNNSQRPYKFFNSKNNRSDHPANGSTRPSIKSATPLLKTPRLSNPEKDRICPNCKHQCHSMKCSRCGTFSHEPRVSPLTGSSYKPIAKRTQAMAEKAAARMAQVDVLLSDDDDDDEEPITVPTTSNGSIFVPTSEVTITPVREHVALMGQPLFVGSMAGSGNVIVTGDEISLKSLALKNATKPEKYNITIPISDCHVFWYHGPVTSHLDRAMFVFIKPSLKAAKDVMKTLAIPVTEWEEYRLDPKDPEEKYSYVAFKTPLNPSLKANLMAFPEQRVTAWKRARATELYSRIRETNEQLPKLKSQLEGIRSLHKDRFDLMKELELPSTSGIRTPVRSYAGGVRKSVVPRNPEVIDLDADELGLMAVRNGAVTPSPKRQWCVSPHY